MDGRTIHTYLETIQDIVAELVIHLYYSILYEAVCEFIRDSGY